MNKGDERILLAELRSRAIVCVTVIERKKFQPNAREIEFFRSFRDLLSESLEKKRDIPKHEEAVRDAAAGDPGSKYLNAFEKIINCARLDRSEKRELLHFLGRCNSFFGEAIRASPMRHIAGRH